MPLWWFLWPCLDLERAGFTFTFSRIFWCKRLGRHLRLFSICFAILELDFQLLFSPWTAGHILLPYSIPAIPFFLGASVFPWPWLIWFRRWTNSIFSISQSRVWLLIGDSSADAYYLKKDAPTLIIGPIIEEESMCWLHLSLETQTSRASKQIRS